MFGGEDMVRHVLWGRIRWVKVGVGVVATMLLAYLLTRFVVYSVIFPYLYRTYIAEGPGVNAREDALFNTFTTSSLLIALLLAFFIGGLLVGGLVAAFPGLNGAVSAATAAVGCFAWYAGPLVPWIWEPISHPGEVYTRAENISNLLGLSVLFCAVFPFAVLMSYLGGRLGSRFLRA